MTEMRHTLGAVSNPLGDTVARALAATGGWSIPAMRQPGFDMIDRALSENEFRALAPLPERAQLIVDRAVVEVGLQRLTFAADIMAEGLVYNLPDPLSITQIEYYKSNRVGAAQRTMTPSARGENKLPGLLPGRLPVYLTTDRFELDIRTLKMSQRVGMPLDVTLVQQCVRAVNEAIEDAAINGATTLDGEELVVNGYAAPGALNAPGAEAEALTAAAWTSGTTVGSTVFSETMAMIAKLQGNRKYGPYYMYVPTVVGNALDADYTVTGMTTTPGRTIRERLLMMPNLKAIRVADMLPATKVLLIQMTSDVVDMVVGQRPTVIPWTSLDGFTIHNLVMAIMIPRFRSDYNGDSGVVVGTLQ